MYWNVSYATLSFSTWTNLQNGSRECWVCQSRVTLYYFSWMQLTALINAWETQRWKEWFLRHTGAISIFCNIQRHYNCSYQWSSLPTGTFYIPLEMCIHTLHTLGNFIIIYTCEDSYWRQTSFWQLIRIILGIIFNHSLYNPCHQQNVHFQWKYPLLVHHLHTKAQGKV